MMHHPCYYNHDVFVGFHLAKKWSECLHTFFEILSSKHVVLLALFFNCGLFPNSTNRWRHSHSVRSPLGRFSFLSGALSGCSSWQLSKAYYVDFIHAVSKYLTVYSPFSSKQMLHNTFFFFLPNANGINMMANWEEPRTCLKYLVCSWIFSVHLQIWIQPAVICACIGCSTSSHINHVINTGFVPFALSPGCAHV